MESLKEYHKTVITRLVLTAFFATLGLITISKFNNILLVLITLIFIRYVYVILNPVKYPHPALAGYWAARMAGDSGVSGTGVEEVSDAGAVEGHGNSDVFTSMEYTPSAINPTTYATAKPIGASGGESPKLMNSLIKIDEVVYNIMVWNKSGDQRTRGQKAGRWVLLTLGTIFGVIGLLLVVILFVSVFMK